MARTLKASVQGGISWTYTDSQAFGDTTIQSGFNFSKSLSSGTGADQADRLYVGNLTIGASANTDLDLAAGVVDVFGNSLTFARVKAFWLSFDPANVGSSVSIGGAASNVAQVWFNATTDKEKVDKTGFSLHFRSDATGWPITAGTGDLLRITNLDVSNSVIVNVAIVGASV